VKAFEALATSPQQRTVIVPAELSSLAGALEGIKALTDTAQAASARPARSGVPTTTGG
jgi:hypothetical protein